MKNRILLIGAVAAISILLTQCTKDPLDHLTQEESRIYITNYDTTAVFTDYKTFRIADSVANIENNQLQNKTLNNADVQIISAVRAALEQRGYTEVAPNASADLGITVSTITNTATHLINYSDYGGAYGGYWDPYLWGYDNYSYYFPTYYGLYQTNETALSIDAIDLKHAAQNGNKLEVVWSGLIRGSGIFTSTAPDQIAALFAQSPYLKTIQ